MLTLIADESVRRGGVKRCEYISLVTAVVPVRVMVGAAKKEVAKFALPYEEIVMSDGAMPRAPVL